MRLAFVEPLLPALVDKPREGDEWIHEIKFDGYRSQIIVDHDVRIFTRNGHNWTAKYRNLVGAVKRLGVESAVIDGEIVDLNEAGLSDFAALRKAITRREQDLYFVAFDLLWKLVQEHAGPAPKGMRRPATQWVKPGIIGRVKHLRGEDDLRHASLEDFRETDL